MGNVVWQDIQMPPGNADHTWELFHENSKVGRHNQGLSDEEVRARIRELHDSLPFEGYPAVGLPASRTRLGLSLEEAITSRVSTRNLSPQQISLQDLAALLHYSYGVTRDNKDNNYPRPFRAVPSGGALYPLEIFFHSAHIEGLAPGLYHYSPAQNKLRLLQQNDQTARIAEMAVYREPILGSSLLVFITAMFERSIFKYGDRGYRFVLLEAGHAAQNLNLVSNALGLGSLNIGGFFDREMDDFLGLDGITHSTIYMVAIGKKNG